MTRAKSLRNGSHIACALAALAMAISGRVGIVVAQDLSTQATSDNTSNLVVAKAIAFEHGEGVAKDQLRAALLYCEAARNGDPDAQFHLGVMYAYGRGVLRDDATAGSLFATAAASGHSEAKRLLQFVSATTIHLPECMQPPDGVPWQDRQVASGPDPFAHLSADKQQIVKVVSELAPGYSVNPRLALAVIAVESNFVPTARSIKDARGLMQLIPDTAARFKVKNAYDVRDNVRGGLAYLRWLLSYYQGQVALALAAYNAGEGVVDKYGGIPPYPETRNYVRRVLGLFGNDRHPYDPAVADPSLFLARPAAGVM